MNDLALDHVVIAVADLETATADYVALLGRAPSWRGSHPQYGTRNTLFRIENTYVELLAPEGKPKKSGNDWAGELGAFLDARGDGLYALALGTPDIDSTTRDMRTLGLDVLDPAGGEGVDEIGGVRRQWRNARVSPKTTNGARIFFIQHRALTAGLQPAPPLVSGGAFVKRMDHAVVLSADMEASRRLWGDVLGARLALDRTFPERNTRILFFRLGDITIEISGGAQQTEEGLGKPDRLWGIAWGVDDLAATCERLRSVGIDASGPRPGIKPGTLVATVRSEHAHGVATLLIEHTAQSFRPESRQPHGAAFDNAPGRRAFELLGLDHIVISAADADATAAKWAQTLGLQPEPAVTPDATHMKLARLPAGNAFVELAQPLSEDHRIARSIADRGPGMFSISLEVDNLEAAAADLSAKGVPVSAPEPGVWANTRIARINKRATNGVSIQLIERLSE